MAVYINVLNGGNITITTGGGGGGSSGHPETRFTLEGGTVETYDITGTLDYQWMVDNGYNDTEMWIKPITQADIGNTVTSIGAGTFSDSNPTSLTSVTIPSSVTSIGNQAFYNCTNLTSVTFQGKTLAQVQEMDNYPWNILDESIINVA